MLNTSKLARKPRHRKAKTVVAREAGFSIRTKGGGFIVQVRRRGINETKTFSTLDAAKLHCQSLHTTQLNEGLNAFSLGPHQRDDATKALALLEGRATLQAAAQAWLRLHPAGDAVTVSQLFEQHMADLRHRGRRARTIQTRQQFLKRFSSDHGTKAAGSITREDVEQWLALRVPEKSFNTLRVCLMAAFSFALVKRLVEVNPVSGIRPKQFDRAEPHFWSAETVQAIIRAAAERDQKTAQRQSALKTPSPSRWLPLTPYFALSAFAGLRPDEVARMDWSNINFAEKLIRLPASASKVRRARLVPMEKALTAWLLPYKKAAGPLTPSPATIRRARKSILVDASLPAKWPQDVLRHSFATHWMAVHAHEGRLAEILGNSPTIVQRHYKGLTTRKEGAKYFAIAPVRAGSVMQLKRKSA